MTTRIARLCTSPVLCLLFRLLLGVVFLYAGAVKVSDPLGFAHALSNYHLLPGWMINPVAITLPWIELVVGASLFLGLWTLGGGFVALCLLGIFAGALGISLARGLDIACGCFSTANSSGVITWGYLARDLVLVGMALHVLLFDRGLFSAEGLMRKIMSSLDKK